MPGLSQDAPPYPLGWLDVKQLYVRGVPLKEVSRLSQFSQTAIKRHGKAWKVERAQLPALVKAQVLQRWGQDAQQQAQELMITIARNVELVEGEMLKLEQHPKTPKRLQAMSQIQAILTQATQSLRLLMGSATERHEVVSLAQLVVELRAKGYGTPSQGVAPSRGKGPVDTSLPLPHTPPLPLPVPAKKTPPEAPRGAHEAPDGASREGRPLRGRPSIFGDMTPPPSLVQVMSSQPVNAKRSPSQDSK